ncbi:uncharacterized protein TRIADDRAFT_55032 [Trichoplax adhaerens]|uniref:Cytidyltransferase-like domain-containing protein n=1 Tax=Trichoplax adhaerens TaxID=10228 RepID=B3RQL6_TRIAD|nr:hypothetical protein TRIADDRAFT_55032 [Trichoplax adhaerens]EDV26714.1 hypothetical protein TRIADDRAFT_55032 [Trichoplax adhaerens]|eukprot:XP_002110710.1 hypothetical protein TRIADDRAFT_55032 [Trichoplax adhaerens]
MVANKTLSELMESTHTRIARVKSFLRDIQPSIQYHVVPIIDPFGPSITEKDIQCIVVSQETLKGGSVVNEERSKKVRCVNDITNNYDPLVIKKIDLVAAESNNQLDWMQDVKISSTTLRQKILSDLLQPLKDEKINAPWTKKIESFLLPDIPKQRLPYLIGLTGGIASGKTSISARLEKLGAAIINCDKLAHKAYLPGTKSYSEILKVFGKGIIGENDCIDRKSLSAIVFANADLLEKLNNIVWPAVADLVRQEVQIAATNGTSVCVIEAALLLEANWKKFLNEVWVSTIPVKEAITRVVKRDNVNEEQAKRRIESQMTNAERINHADVVLTTLWEPEITQKQVEFAWQQLNRRIGLYQSLSIGHPIDNRLQMISDKLRTQYSIENGKDLLQLDTTKKRSTITAMLDLCELFSYWLKDADLVKLAIILAHCDDQKDVSRFLDSISSHEKALRSIHECLDLHNDLHNSGYRKGRTTLDGDFINDMYFIGSFFTGDVSVSNSDICRRQGDQHLNTTELPTSDNDQINGIKFIKYVSWRYILFKGKNKKYIRIQVINIA